jgi:hypothetical protein
MLATRVASGLSGKMPFATRVASGLSGKMPLVARVASAFSGKIPLATRVASAFLGKRPLATRATSVLSGKRPLATRVASVLSGKMPLVARAASVLSGKMPLAARAATVREGSGRWAYKGKIIYRRHGYKNKRRKIVDNFPPFENTIGFLIEKDFLYSARVVEEGTPGEWCVCVCVCVYNHAGFRGGKPACRQVIAGVCINAWRFQGFRIFGFTDLLHDCSIYKAVTKTATKVVYISRTCKFFF